MDNGGAPVYFVDPGINGVYHNSPDGSSVQKFTAPKATLVWYIIKGILGGQLPWGLVLFGVFIAIVLELCGVSALAFAVGVYLPALHFRADFRRRGGALAGRSLHPEQTRCRAADRRPTGRGRRQEIGVLLASGYIAGGTLAGVLFAFLAIPRKDRLDAFEKWATAHNPFFHGPPICSRCFRLSDFVFCFISLAAMRFLHRDDRALVRHF